MRLGKAEVFGFFRYAQQKALLYASIRGQGNVSGDSETFSPR
jgi:hypothetical protein